MGHCKLTDARARAMTSPPPPAAATHEPRPAASCSYDICSYNLCISASDQQLCLAAAGFPPPVVSQRYQNVIHTLFILGADDIHTVRGVRACMWSRLVMRGCADS